MNSRRSLVLLAGIALLPVAAARVFDIGQDGPYNAYFDPAFAGAPTGFAPDGIQNYGETGVDGPHHGRLGRLDQSAP